MRLCVSAEFVRAGRVGGTEQALHYVVDGLAKAIADDDELTVIGSDVGVDPNLMLPPPTHATPRFVQESLSFGRLGRFADSYYFPNYFTPPLPKQCRVVTTLPDLQCLTFPANFSRRKRSWLAAAHRWTLRHADAVTVYSSAVLHDIERHYGTRHLDRVSVVPNPVSWDRFGDLDHASRDRPFVLSVASQYAHKNLATLVDAFALVHERVPDLQLVLVGQFGDQLVGVRRAEDVRSLIRASGLDGHVISTGYIDVTELGALYRDAELFVFPSLFEGFGLPPVEALGFGVPVITTKQTSIPEVTLGLAEYVDDPLDHRELADRIVAQVESGTRLSPEVTTTIRERYSVEVLGRQMYELMVSAS